MVTTLTSRAAASAVALVAGVISYGHIRDVAMAAGESQLAAALLPVGIDGLIIVATLAMLEDKRAGRLPRLSARFALVFGIAATVAFNVASAESSWSARAVAAVPAASFLLAVEVLARTGRRPAGDTTPAGDDGPAPATGTGPDTAGVAAGGSSGSVNGAGSAASSASGPARPDPSSRSPHSRSRSGSSRSGSSGSSSRRRVSAADRVAAAVAESPDATAAQIAARIGVSERTVQRYRPGSGGSTPAGGAPAPAAGGVVDSGGSGGPVGSGASGGAVDSGRSDDDTLDLFSSNGHTDGGAPVAPVPAGAFTRSSGTGVR